MDTGDIVSLIILAILLILSAFFSSAETALTTVNKIRLRSLAEAGDKRAKQVLAITEDSGKLLSAILIGNNIVNLSASSLATTLAVSLWGSIGAGIATGAAIVSVAPAAAMWVATTFGTASTGTAISALSGAAAQSAALAWLGGGAVAAGGGGMAAGHAFLALAGPIGWAVAGATLLTSITLFSVKKIKLDKQKKEQIEAIKRNTETTWEIAGKIQLLIDEVTLLRDQLNNLYANCLYDFGKDFSSIPEERQLQLGALVNNTKALAASLGKSID